VVGRISEIMVAIVLILALGAGVGRGSAGDDPGTAPPSLGPDDISIGEPIAVPFNKPSDRLRQEPSAVSGPPSVLVPAANGPPGPHIAPPQGAAAPNGWLGLALSESKVPGRWSVVEITPLGPAEAAGIAVGDDLASIDGSTLGSADQVAQALTAISSGQTVRLNLVRGERVAEVTVVAVPRPSAPAGRDLEREWQPAVPIEASSTPPRATASALAPAFSPAPARTFPEQLPSASPAPDSAIAPPAATASGTRGRIALGVRTVPIDPGIRNRFQLRDDAGAYVIGVVGDLPASRAGIPPGSVIVKMNEQPVRSPEELTRLVTSGPLDRPVPVEFVLPGGAGRRIDVRLQSLEAPLERALVGDIQPQPTSAPTLESLPRTSRRPVTAEVQELRREIDRLRGLLEAAERRLDRLSR